MIILTQTLLGTRSRLKYIGLVIYQPKCVSLAAIYHG